MALSNLTSEEREQTSKNILVVGGSLGAQVLNDTVPESYKQLLKSDDGFCILHQTGAGNQTQVISAYSDNDMAYEKKSRLLSLLVIWRQPIIGRMW